MLYLVVYGSFIIFLVWINERNKKQTIEHFFVADRRVGGVFGGMSIAASWIWAPAIFVSTRVGYNWGYSALVWFVIPNMLSLILFAPFANKVRQKIPEGFTYIEYIKDKDGGFRTTQLWVQISMQVVIFALQLTAGAKLLSFVSGVDYGLIVIIMALIALAYSLWSGLNSSIFTDWIQYIIILIAIAVIYFGLPYDQINFSFERLRFEPFKWNMLMEFGFGSAIGLLFAIFADHQQWQRAFSIKKDRIVRTYITGGLLHGVVTFSLGTLGVFIFMSGFKTSNVAIVGADFINSNMPILFSIVFVFMALCGLCSTLDSGLCAFGSLFSNEFEKLKNRNKINVSRFFMVCLSIAGVIVAFCNLGIITLWFIASTIRLSAFAPTIMSIWSQKYRGIVGTISIIVGLLVGGPIFFYGINSQVHEFKTLGMALSIGVSAFVSVGYMLYKVLKPGGRVAHEAN